MSFGPIPPKPEGSPTSEERMWALLTHLSPLVSLGTIGPLIVWLIYKDKSFFIADQAKEALNFHLAGAITILICIATCVGIVVAPVIAVGVVVYSIIAAIESNKGVVYRYPYTFRLIS